MGLCFGSQGSGEQQEAKSRSDRIDREICEQARREPRVLRILLLGAAESGKSTLVKQMKIIHSRGFSEQELSSFKPAVLDNLLGSMKFVLHGMGLLRINLANRDNKVHARSILSCIRCFDEDHLVLPFVSCALKHLWADAGVRAATSRGCEYELNDSAHYFFEHMVRILSPDFLPTAQDVLRVRVRTSGVLETQFKMKGLIFRMYDVGGQRTEHRKWISCFEDVNAVLFVVAMSGYDMKLQEDTSVNRLRESMKLFASICNNVFFKTTSMILFLNKIDLFQEKILHSGRHLRYYFPKYTGTDHDVDAAARYIAGLFLGLNRASTKCIYHHFTTATDTSNVQVVFQVVMETIIRENLEAVYLI